MRGRHYIGGFFLLFLFAFPTGAEERRIVSLAPSITETLFALGAGDSVVGVSDVCDWPPEARRIERVGSYLKPNVEAIIAHRPDVILVVPSPGNREAVESLMKIGLRVVLVSEGPTLSNVYASMRAIAAEAGRSYAGSELVAKLRREIDDTSARLLTAPRRRVLVVLQRDPLVAVGEGNLLDELLRLARAENVAAGIGRWPRLSLEHVQKVSPEVVLDTVMAGPGAADQSFYRDLGLVAAREGKVYSVSLDEVLRPGPRLGVGLRKLAELIHPEVFSAGH